MNVRAHATLFTILAVGSFIGPAAVILYSLSGSSGSPSLEAVCGALLFLAVSALLFLYVVPARCDIADCGGQMRPTWEGSSFGEYRLHYRCSRCGRVYDGKFTMKFGGPNDWN